MKASAEYGYTFIIEAGAAIFKIGISEDLAFCKSVKASAVMTGMIDMNQYTVQCRQFLNKSVELVCDPHKLMESEAIMNKIRSQRVGLHSDNIDCNAVMQHTTMCF